MGTPRPCCRWVPRPPKRHGGPSPPAARRWTTTSAVAEWPVSSRALRSLNRAEEEYLAIAAQDLTLTADEIAGFPLAQVGADRPLPLRGPVNPAHAAMLAALARDAVAPLLGPRDRPTTESDWLALGTRIAPHEAWVARKPVQRIEKLGAPRMPQSSVRAWKNASPSR